MADPIKSLAAVLKKIKAEVLEELPQGRPDGATLLEEFLTAFMHWEANGVQAKNARRKLADAFVDHNDLRIALPHEIAAAIGDRYPLALERSLRLRAALRELYKREHAISLSAAALMDADDAVKYVRSLEGVPAYVASRIALRLGLRIAPVDYRMLDLLVKAKAAPGWDERAEELTPQEVSEWLGEVIGGKGLKGYTFVEACGLLQAWSDENGESRKSDPELGGEPLRAPAEPVRRKKVKRTRPPARVAPKRPERGGPKPRGRG